MQTVANFEHPHGTLVMGPVVPEKGIADVGDHLLDKIFRHVRGYHSWNDSTKDWNSLCLTSKWLAKHLRHPAHEWGQELLINKMTFRFSRLPFSVLSKREDFAARLNALPRIGCYSQDFSGDEEAISMMSAHCTSLTSLHLRAENMQSLRHLTRLSCMQLLSLSDLKDNSFEVHLHALKSLRTLTLSFAFFRHKNETISLDYLTLNRLTSLQFRHYGVRTRVNFGPFRFAAGLKHLGITIDKMLSVDFANIATIKLKSLKLVCCGVEDECMDLLAGITSLTFLSLSCREGISRGGALRLQELKQLECLEVSQMGLGDSFFSALTSLNNLRCIDTDCIDDSSISLPEFQGLTELRLHSTNFSDKGLANLIRISSLQKLYVSPRTAVTASALAILMNAMPSCESNDLGAYRQARRISERGVQEATKMLDCISRLS